MLEPGSFDVHKKAAVLIIAMLGCSEVDIEVSDVGIKTAESDDCREISRDDGNTNRVLAII